MKGDGIQHAITDQFGIWDTHGIESSFGSLWDLIMATDLVMNMEIDSWRLHFYRLVHPKKNTVQIDPT